MKEGGEDVTLYIDKMGEKKIWKPDRYVVSRRIKIAESMNDLLAGNYK